MSVTTEMRSAALEPTSVVVRRQAGTLVSRGPIVRKTSPSSTSAWRTPQNRSVMPFVHGEFTSVRRAGSGAPRASCRGV